MALLTSVTSCFSSLHLHLSSPIFSISSRTVRFFHCHFLLGFASQYRNTVFAHPCLFLWAMMLLSARKGAIAPSSSNIFCWVSLRTSSTNTCEVHGSDVLFISSSLRPTNLLYPRSSRAFSAKEVISKSEQEKLQFPDSHLGSFTFLKVAIHVLDERSFTSLSWRIRVLNFHRRTTCSIPDSLQRRVTLSERFLEQSLAFCHVPLG